MNLSFKSKYIELTITEIIGIILIFLKLFGIIKWSWWLVLLPIYGPFAIIAAVIVLILLITYIIERLL